MTRVAGAFSFSEKIRIYFGILANKLAASSRDIAYDYSVLSAVKGSGDFQLINATAHKVLFSLNSCKFSIRKNSSDSAVFNQVFVKEEYQPLIEILKNVNVTTIIDAGANAGYTSLFLNKYFPSASILAIEPSVKNRAILDENIRINNLENSIKIVPYGLWSHNVNLEAAGDFRDNKDWSYKVDAVEDGDIQGRTLLSIMQENDIADIDILKVDIEGAEKELFAGPEIATILGRTKSVAIETHKEIGIDKLIFINQHLINAGFDFFTIDECTFGLNKNLVKV